MLAVSLAGSLAVTFFVMARASKQYDAAKVRREGVAPARRCSTCKSTMDYAGLKEIKLTGWLDPNPSVENENLLPVEAYECPTCRKVEFFQPPAALD